MAKVSEVIERLQGLRDRHGDLPVTTQCSDNEGRMLDATHDIFFAEVQPGFLFEGRPDRIIIRTLITGKI